VFLKAIQLALADTMSISDSESKAVGMPIADSLSISDSIARVVAFLLTQADTMAISDTEAKGIEMAHSDTVPLADSMSTVTAFIRAFSDNVAIADDISKGIQMARSENITIADAVAKQYGLALSDVMAMLDTISKQKFIHLTLHDTMAITDVMVKTGTWTYPGIQIIVELYNRAIEMEQENRSIIVDEPQRDIDSGTRRTN